MEAHERRCWRNPHRFCDYCDNKGGEYDMGMWVPCFYCEQHDEKITPWSMVWE